MTSMSRLSLVAALAVSALVGASACGGHGGGAKGDGGGGAGAGSGGAGASSDGAAGEGGQSPDASVDVADAGGVSDAAGATGTDVPVALPDALGPDVLPAGSLAFDVTATLSIVPPAGQQGAWTTFPRAVPFTFVWNAAAGAAIAGAAGNAAAATVTSAGDGLFRTDATLALNVLPGTMCGPATFDHLEIVFSTDGATLTGTARGTLSYQTSDTTWSAPATAVLTGKLDTTPPTLSVPQSPVDPLAPLTFAASEPLPPTPVAQLARHSTGEVISNLAPILVPGGGAVIGFTAPNVALPSGTDYELHVGADFAGNRPAAAMTFTTSDEPPLVAQDGFESVVGTMFAGAGVLHGGPLTPISGQTSLLLNTGFGGGFGFLPYDLGPSLTVGLSLSPGDTVIRFDTELIAPDPIDSAAFVGAIRIASVGGPVSTTMNVAGTGFVKQTLPQLGDVFVSPVKTIELALPPGASGAVTFEIVGVTFQCSQPPSPTVLVLDNLRTQ
jgi:hypothetical protein